MITILLIIIYLAFISLGLPDALFGTAWPAMYSEFGVGISAAGICSILVSGGTIISSFFSGVMIRRFGTGKVTAVSVLMTAVALIGISFTGSFVWLCVLAIPLGLGAGSVDAALNNFVALHYEARHMSWLHCFWGIGASMGPVIMSGVLSRGFEWNTGYAIVGTIQSILVLVLFLALPLWKKLEASPSKENDQSNETSLSLKKVLQMPGAKPVLVAFFCYCAVEATTGLWGSTYLVLHRGFSADAAAKWVSAFYVGITFGRFLSGFLTMKVSNKTLIRLGEGLIVIGIVMILLPFSVPILLGIGFFILGLGCAPIYPCMIHNTPITFGKEASQSMMGVQMAFAYVGSTFIPPLFGLITQYISVRLLPGYLFFFTILMIVMVEALNHRKQLGIEEESERIESKFAMKKESKG